MQLGGYMTELAKHGDKLCLVRSMTSKTGVHEEGTYIMHTGYDPRGTIVHPTLGAWAQHFKGRSHKTLPSSVVIGAGSANAGFFPPALSPVPISNAESRSAELQVRRRRRPCSRSASSLMNEFDTAFRDKYKSREVKAYTEFYDETMNLLTSKDLEAFDLTKEDHGHPRHVRQGLRPGLPAGPPPGSDRRALRRSAHRRLGHAQHHRRRHGHAPARAWTRPSPRCSPTSSAPVCSTPRSWCSVPSSAARRTSTKTTVATTIRRFTPPSSQAAA